MSKHIELYRELNSAVGRVQGDQGNEGCYMELLEVVRQKAAVYQAAPYIFPADGYERAMTELMNIVLNLPPLQTPTVLAHAMERICAIEQIFIQ